MTHLDPLSPHQPKNKQTKTNVIKFGLPLTKLSGSAHATVMQTSIIKYLGVARKHSIGYIFYPMDNL